MRNLALIVLIFLFLALQAGFLNTLRVEPVNLALLLVVAVVLFSDLQELLVVTLAGGIISDLVSGSPDGLMTLVFLATSLTLYVIFNQLLSRHASRAVLIVSAAFGHLLFVIWFLVFNELFGIFHAGIAIIPSQFFTHQGFIGFIWNMLLAYPVFQLFLWIDELMPKHNVQPIRD